MEIFARMNVFFLTFLLFVGNLYAEDPIKFLLSTEKTKFVHGEPIILRTCITKTKNAKFNDYCVFSISGCTRIHDGLNFLVRKTTEKQFKTYVCYNLNRHRRPVPADHCEFYVDQQSFNSDDLLESSSIVRNDMILLDDLGEFEIKAFYTKGNTTIESNLKNIVVENPKKDSCISKVLPQKDIYELGVSIYLINYSGVFHSDTRVGSTKRVLIDFIPTIIEKCKDSPFYRHALYARALYQCNDFLGGDIQRSDEYKQKYVQQYIQEYPDCWLIPRLLVDYYSSDINTGFGKFSEIGDELMNADIIDSSMLLLKYIKKRDASTKSKSAQ